MNCKYLLPVVAMLLAGCSASKKATNNPSTQTANPISMTAEEQVKTVQSINSFSFDLLGHSDNGENVFISPLSAEMALGMLANGANGSTLNEMAQVMNPNADSIVSANKLQMLNSINRTIIDGFKGSGDEVTITTANAVWGNKGVTFTKNFADVTSSLYDAVAKEVDFSTVSGAREVNKWCNDHTNGKIPSILSESPQPYSVVLTNAVYFQGKWIMPFNKLFTQQRPFTDKDGNTFEVEMMTAERNNWYAETQDMQVACFPYRGDYKMYVLLPKPLVSPMQIVTTLTGEAFAKICNNMSNRLLNIAFPKLELNQQLSFKNPLQEMGMRALFGDADLKAMSPSAGSVDEIIQKTFLKVDEEGTEAAAVTSIMVKTTSANINKPQPIDFHVNHPYIIVITDPNDAIIFNGIIYNPNK